MNTMDLNVSFGELLAGDNYCTILGMKRNKEKPEFIDIKIKDSKLVQDNIRIFDDSNNPRGKVRGLVKATIYEEGKTTYNLAEIEGKDVIINLEKATSKKGNEFWKVLEFKCVDSYTDLSRFEFVRETDINEPEEVEDISELEDLLD